ncbi:MAG: serine hydrolase [Desulfomonile sp.]|nr:serine hydrolase [Desulfomonile sp.]
MNDSAFVLRIAAFFVVFVSFGASPAAALEPVHSEGLFQQLIGNVAQRSSGGPKPDAATPVPLRGPTRSGVVAPVNALPAASPARFRPSVRPSAPVGDFPRVLDRVETRKLGVHERPADRPTAYVQPVTGQVERVMALVPARAGAASPPPRVPQVKAKALYCVDCSSNQVVLARNVSEPLPIASITKLLTAMVVIDEMKLDTVITIPDDIKLVPRHRVGIRGGDRLTVRDLLHGMLIESGNDCAEALARAYPKGGTSAFMKAMNRKAAAMGAGKTAVFTPSGLDKQFAVGIKGGRTLIAHKTNTASAEDVALIARHAFKYPLIRTISSMKTHTMTTCNATPREYVLRSNDKLLDRPVSLVGAKTGFTNLAGKCIVALFNDEKKAKEYVVVVLNSPTHFKTAEKVYRWVSGTL